MKRILYLECNSGISGDMTVGALLDLGADKEKLVRALEASGIGGYHLHFGRTKKCGIDAYDFDVHLEEEEAEHAHSHHRHETAHDQTEEAAHGHHHHHGGHGHEECGHEEHRHEEHGHGEHGHIHRNLNDVKEILKKIPMGDEARARAERVFEIVAQAEAKAHGIPVEEVHFHEVGAIDSIIDIAGFALCMEDIQADEILVSPLTEGWGTARCQHGEIPVPVPAVANIAGTYGLPIHFTQTKGEMITPTGAAIAAELYSGKKLEGNYKIKKIGIGAGKKDFPHANILRAMLLESV